MEQPEKVKLKLSSKIGKKAPVFVTEFSNGRINTESDLHFECFKSEDRESMSESGCAARKLMATNGRLSYIGSSNDASALQYFIGVRNKNTGKMKLYDSTLFRLKPIMTSNTAANDSVTSVKNYWADRNKLTEEFGAKAQKRLLKSRIKLDVKNDSLDELMNDNSLVASPTPSDPFASTPSKVSYLPSANREASNLDEVFNIHDIMTPGIEAYLLEYADSWLETYVTDTASVKQNFCKFVLQRIDENLHSPHKLKYLLYYNYLVTFQSLTYADLRKKDPTSNIPEPFKGSMLEKFTLFTKSENGRGTRSFPPQQRDKLTSHLIVLALLINDYCVRMSDILQDLKRVTPKQMTTIAQALGCYITSKKVDEQNEKFIELKLPLNVVLPRYKKRQF